MNKCTRCQKDKTTENTNWKIKDKTLQSFCRECQHQYQQTWYSNVVNKSSSIKRAKINTKRNVERNQEFIIEYFKTHPCVDCGNSNLMVLEFDHLSDKDNNICDMVRLAFSLTRIRSEIEKCEVVCRNCHTIRTHTRNKSYRYLALGEYG